MCNMWKERISEGEWTSGRDFQCVSTFVPFCPTSKHSLSLKSVAATFCERCMDCQEVSLISSQFGQRFNEYVRVVASVSACQEWISKHQCASIASMTQQDYCSSFAEYWIVLYWIVLKHIETYWNTLKHIETTKDAIVESSTPICRVDLVDPAKMSPWSPYAAGKRNDGSFKRWLPGLSWTLPTRIDQNLEENEERRLRRCSPTIHQPVTKHSPIIHQP